MRTRRSRTASDWPRKVRCGRITVTVYRRQTPSGTTGFMVSNYADGKRRLVSCSTEEGALEEASKLARRLSERDTVAASMTNTEAIEYASAVEALKPHGVSLHAAASTVAQCLERVGDLSTIVAAVKFFGDHHRPAQRARVAEVVEKLLELKEARGASARYLGDLRSRLGQFAEAFQKDMCHVTSVEVQSWLDAKKLHPANYRNLRRVLNVLFEFGLARGYHTHNVITRVEKQKVRDGSPEIYTPQQITKLFASASPEFSPCLALGAFAGVRTAEILRLDWSDIDLSAEHLTIGPTKAKTRSRRIVPILPNLNEWLRPVARSSGPVWTDSPRQFHHAQQDTAREAKVAWKSNALRHSFISYRLAQTQNAAQTSLEAGNSPQICFRHYRELVKPADAELWFAVGPEAPDNLTKLHSPLAT